MTKQQPNTAKQNHDKLKHHLIHTIMTWIEQNGGGKNQTADVLCELSKEMRPGNGPIFDENSETKTSSGMVPSWVLDKIKAIDDSSFGGKTEHPEHTLPVVKKLLESTLDRLKALNIFLGRG